jgi:hypothetical protein
MLGENDQCGTEYQFVDERVDGCPVGPADCAGDLGSDRVVLVTRLATA